LQSAVKLLLEDEAREDGPLIDLSHRVDGNGSLLMLLIEVINVMEQLEKDNDPAVQAKQNELELAAWGTFAAPMSTRVSMEDKRS
jgi:hypothetical protein